MPINTELNLSDFNTTTRDFIQDGPTIDLVMQNSPCLDYFNRNGMIKREDFNKNIEWSITHKDLAGGTHAGSLRIAQPQIEEIHDLAVLHPVFYWKDIALKREDILYNKDNPLKIANLMQDQFESAMRSIATDMERMIFNDGSDALSGQGLRKAVGVDRTYAGINSTTYPVWDSAIFNTGYGSKTKTALKDPTNTYYIEKELANNVQYISQLEQGPPSNWFSLTSYTMKQIIRDVSKNYLTINFPDQKGKIDLSTGDPRYEGIEFVASSQVPCTSGSTMQTYFLPKQYVRFLYRDFPGFKPTKYPFLLWSGWDPLQLQKGALFGQFLIHYCFQVKHPALCIRWDTDGTTMGSITAA